MEKQVAAFIVLLRTAVKSIADDKVPMMGAALAFYTTFSIAPLLVIALGAIGLIFGKKSDTNIFGAIGF